MKRVIKIFLCCTVLLGSVFLVSAQQTSCKYLVWADEFEQSGAPLTNKWDYDTGGGGWGNNELQTYTNTRTNSWVEGGKLFIKAVKTNGNWSSARLVSRKKGDWLYGRIEVKAKLPVGKGTWPAIWMLPTDWEYGNWPSSGEIDIMEHVGYDPGVIHGTAHTEAYYHSIGTQKGASVTIADAQSAFHVYAIEWNAEKIDWYVDDQLYFTFSNEHKTYKEWPFDKRFHLLLNIAMGGNWGGAQGVDANLTEATMEVDYVRVYQQNLPTPVIEGKNTVKQGDEVVFSTAKVDGVTYSWTFPDGVKVVSGENTNEVKVQWGAASGSVQVSLKSDCQTAQSALFKVNTIENPSGKKYIVPFVNSEGTIVWTTEAGTGNQISLSKNEGMVVTYSVGEPANNPAIVYEFPGLVDFSQYREIALMIKVDPANAPSVIRIDLEDKNGNVNLNDLFKISSFGRSGQFLQYLYQFGSNSDGKYLLNEIKRVKIYFNYGLFGKKGNGSVELKDLYMALPGTTGTKLTELPTIGVYPNPFTDELHFTGAASSGVLQLLNTVGQVIWQGTLGENSSIRLKNKLPAGVYFLQITDRSGELQTLRVIRQ